MTGTAGTPDPAPSAVDQVATASGHGRVYQAGRDLIINETVLPEAVLRPAAEVAAPPGTTNVPLGTGAFVGRSEEMEALKTALASGSKVVIAAVHGLGGIGKSTLAARYAAAEAGRRNPVWWITADTTASIQAGLAGFATALQPELAQTVPLEVLAQRATAWLAAHDGWLLVLDNVTHPDQIAPLLARTKSGRVLVTSRLSEGWHRLDAQSLRLDVLTQGQAIDLLARIASGTVALDGAAELVTELGCLPLAVEQAGAYLHQARISPRIYLTRLAAQPAAVYDQTAEGSDAERTVARIWRLTLDHLTAVPLAGHLLRVLAWYGAGAVPRTLLNGMATPFEAAGALGSLAAYNMITLDEHSVMVHRLVQAVARTPDPADPHRTTRAIDQARDQAATLLYEALSEDRRDLGTWTQERRLIPHIDALAEHATVETDTGTTARLFARAGGILLRQGPRATVHIQRAITGARRALGEDHPDTLAFRSDLASAYRAAGDLDRAIPLYEQVLADARHTLGEDHPHALAFRNDLASAYGAAGDLDRAIPLYEQVLTDCRRALGEDHPHTLAFRNDLASAYGAAGDLDRAITLYEQVRADRARMLGEEHPSTLASRSDLASALRAAGDLEQAISLYEQTLTDSVRVLGEDHPITKELRANLDLT